MLNNDGTVVVVANNGGIVTKDSPIFKNCN